MKKQARFAKQRLLFLWQIRLKICRAAVLFRAGQMATPAELQ